MIWLIPMIMNMTLLTMSMATIGMVVSIIITIVLIKKIIKQLQQKESKKILSAKILDCIENDNFNKCYIGLYGDKGKKIRELEIESKKGISKEIYKGRKILLNNI